MTETFPLLPLEVRNQHLQHVAEAIEKRWIKLKQKKSSFSLYQKKSDAEILDEFQKVHAFRLKLWYRNPGESPHICQEDYQVSQDLLEKGYYRTINNIAFAYNRTDSTYNASTIYIQGQHFIALQEPTPELLSLFFKFLINHHVAMLVRLKPEKEFFGPFSIKYWHERLKAENPPLLKVDVMHAGKTFQPVWIPYFALEKWEDDASTDIELLADLVKNVREVYQTMSHKGPIACHCASGVGRTGTFIAALALAQSIENSTTENLSIEETVLKLSIQRPNMVGTPEQYLMLYRFVDYYLRQK